MTWVTRWTRKRWVRFLFVVGVFVIVAVAVSLVDFTPDLDHLEVGMLSGSRQGNYHAFVEQLSKKASEQSGEIRNIPSKGTVDNLERLAHAAQSCEIHFALVQDGVPPPAGSHLEMIGRLPKSESLLLVGKGAGQITRFEQLRGLRIGVGPKKGGTEFVAREIFGSDDFRRLGITLTNYPIEEQIRLLERGDLDLGAFIIDEDAKLARDTMRNGDLELAAFKHLDVVARRYPYLRHGRIGAGQYDPIGMVPPEDRTVLRVNTLVVGNRCASHAQTVAFLSLLNQQVPRFLDHNRKRGSSSIYRTSSSSKAFFENQGPQLVEEHIPWLVDIMPPSNWVYVVMSISMLFNVMLLGNRFRLWRIDANRLKIERDTFQVIGSDATPTEIGTIQPQEEHRNPETIKQLRGIIRNLVMLKTRCRRYSVSILVPMGGEMVFRYQESVMDDMITRLRLYVSKLEQPYEDPADSELDGQVGVEPT